MPSLGDPVPADASIYITLFLFAHSSPSHWPLQCSFFFSSFV